jgi:leucyl-tRNA synthetase
VSHDEPFQKLAHQGMILGPDGEKMSKSRGNVINPDDVRDKYGADALRCFILFLGPMDRDKPWQESGIDGVSRFLDRMWRICVDDTNVDGEGRLVVDDTEPSDELNKLLHKTIKKVGEDIESLNFNTAISAMMILLNDIYKAGTRPRKVLKPLVQLLAPFAPHLAEELWSKLAPGEGLVALAPWPTFDSNLTVDSVVTIGVQVNGKSRGAIEIAKDAPEAEAVKAAEELETVRNALGGKPIDKVIYKAGKILNLIVKG